MHRLCRWSAAEIYSAAQGRRSLGPRSPRSASASLNRQHTNNRSMRRIDIPEPSRALESCNTVSSDAGKDRPEAAVPAEGTHPLAQGNAREGDPAKLTGAADMQQSPEDSATASEHEQPGRQGSTAPCRRIGSQSPRREAGSSAEEAAAASSSGLEASLGHRGAALSGESEVSELLESRGHGLTFVLSHCVLRAAEGSSLARRLLIDNVYRTLQHISFNPMSAWADISTDVLDIQITYHV